MKTLRTILNLCVILALCLGLTPSGVSAADGVTPPWSSRMALLNHLGGYSYAVAVDAGEQYAYFASGPRLIVADIHTNPGHVSSTDFSPVLRGEIMAIALQGSYAFLAADDAGMIVMDISDRTNMHEVGAYYTGGQTNDIKVVGNLAYLADYYKGLVILNISDPAHPALVKQTRADDGSTFDEDSAFFGIDVAGNYAYLSAYAKNMFVFDITNPATPTLKGSYIPNPAEYGNAWDVKIVGNYAYLVVSDGLRILDISGSGNPVLISTFNTGYNQAISVSISGNMAYVAVNSSGVCQVNITNPLAPKTINGRSGCSTTAPSDFFVLPHNDLALSVQAGSRLYVGASTGLQIYTYSAQSFTGGWIADVNAINDTAIYENRLYVADKLGLEILDASSPANVLGRFNQWGGYKRILPMKHNDKTYILAIDVNNNLDFINVTDLNHITDVRYRMTDLNQGDGTDLAVYGNYLFVTAYSSGLNYLHAFDISNLDSAPTIHYSKVMDAGVKLNKIYIFAPAVISTAPQVTAYLPTRETGLYVYDLSDLYNGGLTNIIEQKTHFSTGTAPYDTVWDVALLPRKGLFFSTTLEAIYLIQPYQITILNANFEKIGQIDVSDFITSDALLRQNTLYITGAKDGVRAYDLTQPAAPTLKAFYNTALGGSGIRGASDGSILIMRSEAGIYQLKLQNMVFLPFMSKHP